MNRVCITLLLCCLSSCRMNKTERMEMSEDSIDTVRIDQGVRKKTVSDSLKGLRMMVTTCKDNCLPFTKN